MAKISVKCPRCSPWLADVDSGMIIGYCSHCNSKIELLPDGTRRMYDPDAEKDPNVLACMDRYRSCERYDVPESRGRDRDDFMSEVEEVMDVLMSFTETQKDVAAAVAACGEFERQRTCELCLDMTDRVQKRFFTLLSEYRDYGMFDEFAGAVATYKKIIAPLAEARAAADAQRVLSYWAEHPDEKADLERQLKEVLERKRHIFMYDTYANSEADKEIARIRCLLERRE